MRINHNIAALNTYRQLQQNSQAQQNSLQKLSSGLRINSAADDAAGLAISEKMRGQIRGLEQAQSNAQDGISLIQTAEGAMSETHSILQRMRELAVQASNETNTQDDRNEIQKEMNQLTSEINRVGNTTQFNTKTLMDGSFDFVAAKAAEVSGVNTTGSITIDDTKTSGYAQGGEITDTGYTGSTPKDRPWVTTGSVDASTKLNITATNNELTFNYGGSEHEIQMTVADHGTGNGLSDLVADIQSKINTELGSGKITVGTDSSNHLTFTAVDRGSDESNKFEVVGGNFAADVIGTASYTEGIDEGDAWIHDETNGYTTGNVSITDSGLNSGNIAIDASNNELTVKVVDSDGTVNEQNITLSNATYDGNSGTSTARADLLSDIQTQLDSAFGADAVTASFDVDNTLKLEVTDTSGTFTAGEGSQISVTGGNAMDELFGSTANHTTYTGEAANKTLTFDLDGASQSITLSNGYYDDADAIVSEINNQLTSEGTAATASNESGEIRITSDSTGVDSDVNNIAGSAAAELSLDSATETSGSDGNRTLSIDVDGESVNASIQEGTYSDMNVLAAAVQSAINNATGTVDDVSVSYSDSKFNITSGSTGTSSTINVNTHPNDDAAGTLGLTGKSGTGTDQEGAEMVFQIGSNENQAMSITISDMRSEALEISSSTVQSGFSSSKNVTNGTNNTGVEYGLNVTSTDDAAAAITAIDNAISSVSAERSKLGSYQNRLEHTINNLGTSAENLTAAESRIRDTDMAKEMMNFTKQNILSQAAQSMLAQANQMPQGVLKLLQ